MITSKQPISLLLLSGGVGQRSGHCEPKQFYELAGHPLIAHSIILATRIQNIREIIVNAPDGYHRRTCEIMETYCKRQTYTIVDGGKTRQESSYILAQAARYDTVLLHESARPFADMGMFTKLIECPEPNAALCYHIAFSMCQINQETQMIQNGVSRDEVFDIQLPQKFDRDTLLKAHKRAIKRGNVFTEDAVMVVSMTQTQVITLNGASKNLKITSPEDFLIAKQIIKAGYEHG